MDPIKEKELQEQLRLRLECRDAQTKVQIDERIRELMPPSKVKQADGTFVEPTRNKNYKCNFFKLEPLEVGGFGVYLNGHEIADVLSINLRIDAENLLPILTVECACDYIDTAAFANGAELEVRNVLPSKMLRTASPS